MLLDQLEDWQEILDLAIEAANTEIQKNDIDALRNTRLNIHFRYGFDSLLQSVVGLRVIVAAEAANTEIQKKAEKQIAKINEKLKF